MFINATTFLEKIKCQCPNSRQKKLEFRYKHILIFFTEIIAVKKKDFKLCFKSIPTPETEPKLTYGLEIYIFINILTTIS